MGLDVLAALAVLAALVYYCVWCDWLRPLLFGGAKSVSRSAPRRAFRLRSRGSARSNATNAGSGHQGATFAPVNVQAFPAAPAAPSAPAGTPAAAGEALTLTPGELAQLAAAVALRARGATVEEALLGGFEVRKGGSANYRRAKELFDTATRAPP